MLLRLLLSAGLIHDAIEEDGEEDGENFRSILGSFENRGIKHNDYEMVIHGFLSRILQLLFEELMRAQHISDMYMFTASRKQNYYSKS